MALENGKIVATGTDIVKMTYRLARSMKKKDSQFITVISGCDVSDEDAEKDHRDGAHQVRQQCRGQPHQRRPAGLLLHDQCGVIDVITLEKRRIWGETEFAFFGISLLLIFACGCCSAPPCGASLALTACCLLCVPFGDPKGTEKVLATSDSAGGPA